MLKNFKFIKSASKKEEFLSSTLPQVAVVGRSNVGKSSLINMLANNKKMAKTSSTPGRTRLVNYFDVNGEFLLVDLPGYGYAEASKTAKSSWDKMLDDYFETNSHYTYQEGELVPNNIDSKLLLVLVLVDCRREPTNLDVLMCDYLSVREIPFVVVMTKADKLSKSEAGRSKQVAMNKLRLNSNRVILTSSEKKQGSVEVENAIREKLNQYVDKR